MEGARLGPYQIDRELGSGGMGKVYAATVAERAPGLTVGDRVALKVVHQHLLEAPRFFKRFMREAELGRSIEHENVVRTHECDQVFAGGRPHAFLVMEYVEGQTLADRGRELELVPEELCRHVAREVCKGLAAIHAAGVVHRDLKPENVLITEDHVVKVMDLGVARLADEQIRLSQSGAFVGSAEYAAPEQFEAGDDVDHRCDLHALGLVLYELSCGQHPYRADGFRPVMKRVCEETPRKVGEINPQLSAFFEELVHTLLEKRRDDRFQSAGELLGVLEEGERSEWWRERARRLQATTKRPLRRIRIPRETAVYGREKELARLTALYERAKAGDGQVVLIEGEAGIGKSRLVDELITRLQSSGEDLNFLFGSYPPGGAATASGAFSSAFREQMGEAGAATYLPQTPLLVPAFEALLRGDVAPTGVEPLTKDSLVTCFVQATRVLGAERPTVILIDDLHFAPEEARSLFAALAIALPGHRVLLVGTTRPGVEGDWRGNLSRYDHVHPMQLERLFPKDLADLLADSFGSQQLAHAIGMQIVVKSDGNPFFAFEIIRGLREGQFITQKDDGTWASTRVIDDIAIPSSVLDLVNARVADLTEEERDLLDIAACWGYEFDPVLIAAVVGLGPIPALKRFGQIERQHRLARSVGRNYVFDHHQVQEALYGKLNEQLREHYHAALATALETRTKAAEKDIEELAGALCVDLCEHFLKGARGESALRYLPAALSHLRKGYLNAQVIDLTERALAVPGLLTGPERARSYLQLADALNALARRARQEECAREAERLAEAADDDDLRARAGLAIGNLLWHTSRHEEAETAARHGLELARACGDREIEARATALLGNVFLSQDRVAEAQRHHERCLALCREIEFRKGESVATGNLGAVLQAQGRHAEALEHLQRRLAIAREEGNRRGEAIATGNLGVVLHSEGRLEEAREHNERRLALCREIGDRLGEAIATGNLGVVLSSLGRLEEAQEHQERSLALSREIGNRSSAASAQHNLGQVLRELGEREGSDERLLSCLALCEQIGQRRGKARTHLALGSLRAARSRDEGRGGEGGRESLLAALNVAQANGFSGAEVLARCELALLAGEDPQDALAAYTEHDERLRSGDRREARLLLFRATGAREHLAEAKRLLDAALANVPEEHRGAMRRNVRVNREILAAWASESGEPSGDDEPHGTESVTRVVPRE